MGHQVKIAIMPDCHSYIVFNILVYFVLSKKGVYKTDRYDVVDYTKTVGSLLKIKACSENEHRNDYDKHLKDIGKVGKGIHHCGFIPEKNFKEISVNWNSNYGKESYDIFMSQYKEIVMANCDTIYACDSAPSYLIFMKRSYCLLDTYSFHRVPCLKLEHIRLMVLLKT